MNGAKPYKIWNTIGFYPYIEQLRMEKLAD